MFEDSLLIHYVQVSDHTNATFDSRPHIYLVFWPSQIAILDKHALLHGPFVQLEVVVCLCDVLWLRRPFEVKVASVTIRVVDLVLDVAENVEEFLVVSLCELDLLWQVVLHVFICASLAWLVRLVLFRTHRHHIFDPLLNNSAFNAFHSQDELKQVP